MTAKEQTLHNLHQARTAHIRWLNAIKLLISGIDVNPNAIELMATDSTLGKWFYAEASQFSLGTCRMVIEEIEILLLNLHDKYMKIYLIYFGKKKKSLLESLVGKSSGVNEHEIELSNRYYEEIVEISDRLKHKLRIFESQLSAMEECKFKAHTIQETTASNNFDHVDKEIESSNTVQNAYFYGTRGR